MLVPMRAILEAADKNDYAQGAYHAIRIAIGKDRTSPIANPAVTEIRLLAISVQNTPLCIIVNIDLNVITTFGKLLEVCGLSDRSCHNTIAVIKDSSSHARFGILPVLFFLFICVFPSFSLLTC